MFVLLVGGKIIYVGGLVQDGELIIGSIQFVLENDKVVDVDVMVGVISMDIGFNVFFDKVSLFVFYGEFVEVVEVVYDLIGDVLLQLVGYMVGQDWMMQEFVRFVVI